MKIDLNEIETAYVRKHFEALSLYVEKRHQLMAELKELDAKIGDGQIEAARFIAKCHKVEIPENEVPLVLFNEKGGGTLSWKDPPSKPQETGKTAPTPKQPGVALG